LPAEGSRSSAAKANDEAIRGAVSSVIDRGAIGGMGGAARFAGFYSPTGLVRADRQFSWDPVSNANSPEVDLCEVEVVRAVRTLYAPGACVNGNFAESREEAVWKVFAVGDPGEVTLPTIPNNWPRARTFGYVNPGATPENDRLQMRVRCLGLGAAPDFDFNAADFDAVPNSVTHTSSILRNF
jgi:hypothetical protein